MTRTRLGSEIDMKGEQRGNGQWTVFYTDVPRRGGFGEAETRGRLLTLAPEASNSRTGHSLQRHSIHMNDCT
jgi:hypothetical protein